MAPTIQTGNGETIVVNDSFQPVLPNDSMDAVMQELTLDGIPIDWSQILSEPSELLSYAGQALNTLASEPRNLYDIRLFLRTIYAAVILGDGQTASELSAALARRPEAADAFPAFASAFAFGKTLSPDEGYQEWYHRFVQRAAWLMHSAITGNVCENSVDSDDDAYTAMRRIEEMVYPEFHRRGCNPFRSIISGLTAGINGYTGCR